MKPVIYNLKTKKLFISLMISLIMISGFSFHISADDSDTVKIGYYENEVFEEGAGEGAVKKGYAYEYYRKLSEYTGWKYEYVYGSFGDLYEMLLEGKIDLLAGLAYRKEREGLLLYPDEPMGNETYSLVKHSDDIDISADPSSMNGKKFGVLNSAMVSSLKEYLEKYSIDAEVITFDDYEALFKSFDEKQIDILAAEGDGAYGRDNAEVLCGFGASDYYLTVNINRPDLLQQLNQAQIELYNDEPNYMNSLRQKYYPVSISSRAFSEAERNWIKEHDTLQVGYLENYLPYSDTDDSGVVTGVVLDILLKMFKDLNIDMAIVFTGYRSYDQMISDINDEIIDVAFPVGGGLYYSEENGIYQSNPVLSSSTELVYKGDYSDQKCDLFAVNENNRMQYYYIRTYYPDAKIDFYPSIDACLEAVLSNKAGATTLNGLRANDVLKNSKYKDLSLRQTNHNDDRCFGVKIGNEGLLKLINRGINVLGEDYIQSLAYHYTDGLYSYTTLDMIKDNMAIFGTALMLLAGLIIFFLVHDSRRTKKEMKDKEEARLSLEAKNKELAENKEALSDALIAAEHANRAKTTFLNNMSHDIRTPMNAIVGFTALAASHIDNKEQVKDYLSKISVSSQHLLSLINDVLDMSRIESGKVKIEEGEVHLPDIIHDIRNIIQANITAKQQELYIDTQDVIHEDIITDKLRLNQILLNILSNAIKFTPAEGTISLRIIEKPSEDPDYANFEFRIKDNGIGMSEEFQKTIFEAFSRERTSTVSGIQGTGLGMAITKNIVDMMGGTITVNSKEGKGSEFIVDLKCRISETDNRYEKLPELQGLRALVADDDVNSCLSVCSMLRSIGMRADWTQYGKEAVIRTKDALDNQDPFRAYIIDWQMPDLNGVETVRRIRKVIGDDAPIIILTAYDWSDIEEEAIEAGVTAFCAKPIFLSELREILSKPFRNEPEKVIEEKKEYDFSGRKILLAEDNVLNQQIAVAILQNVGFEVDIANNGQEALNKLQESADDEYDVILMDIQMPIMDGYEASKLIRSLPDETKANIPIIAVTANAFEEDRKDAHEAGMNGHLAKPYEIDKMMETLKEILEWKK